jgi:hypothetical protein
MLLPLQNFPTLVQNMAAGVQGGAAQLIDLSVGSVLRAMLEACASIALWMQWLILQVLSMTRAATSTGADLDSWMADFSFTRLPGSAAQGQVTFGRYSIGIAAVIPVGQVVSTSDGSQNFTVVADSSNPAWNGSNGFALAPSVASITVAVVATSPGTQGNVQAGAVGLLAQPLPGVDTVTNTQAFVGGVDPEADQAFRERFKLYVNSRSLGTLVAVESALASLRQGLRYLVVENASSLDHFTPGQFTVVLDDGTGFPPSALLTDASAAVEAVRPIGSVYAVIAPAVTYAAVTMAVATSNPATAPAVKAQIEVNITQFLSELPIAGAGAISRLEAIAHNTDPSVISVSGTEINGTSSDLQLAWNAVCVVSNVTVS